MVLIFAASFFHPKTKRDWRGFGVLTAAATLCDTIVMQPERFPPLDDIRDLTHVASRLRKGSSSWKLSGTSPTAADEFTGPLGPETERAGMTPQRKRAGNCRMRPSLIASAIRRMW